MTTEQRYEKGDPDLAEKNYYEAFNALPYIFDKLHIDAGSRSGANERSSTLREKGWINIFKHKESKDIEKFIYDYVQGLERELKTIEHLGLQELQQRKKDLR